MNITCTFLTGNVNPFLPELIVTTKDQSLELCGCSVPWDRFQSYDSYCRVFKWDLLLVQSYLKALHISVCRVPPPDVANSPPVNVRHSGACTSTCPNWTCGANMAAPSPSQDVNSMWILITDQSQDLVGSWISLWSSRQIKNKIPSPSWGLQTSSLPIIFGTMKKPIDHQLRP